ncbi:MAG: hypothetical protein ACK4WB_08080 [Desulfatiglandales bacterium]
MAKTPAKERLECLKLLPEEVVKSMTKEEIQAFLFEEEWPDSLKEKLKDYLFDE